MFLIDTHAHLDGLGDVEAVNSALQRAMDAGVRQVIAIGGDSERNAFAVEMAKTFPFVNVAVGYDRDCAEKDVSFIALRKFIDETDVVSAIGETGLDFYYYPELMSEQIELFSKNLELACEFNLPVVVHSREADIQTIDILKSHIDNWHGNKERVGVLHCFTGDRDFMRKILDLGLYISFSGIVTFKNADALRDVVQYVPDDRILLETDTPYLAPIPYRGKKNEPAYIVETAVVIAELKGISQDNLATITTNNAVTLLGLE